MKTLAEEGLSLHQITHLVPIYEHRYVVCSPDTEECPVVSIWTEEDAIVYGRTLQEYLTAEFLNSR